MFELVPFKYSHVEPMLDQPINQSAKDWFTDGPGKDIEDRGTAYTILVNGTPMLCGSVEKIWDNRGVIWCVFNDQSKSNFIPVFRGIKALLNKFDFNRIEVSVPCDFEQGKRRALMLGFKLEIPRAEKYLPNGADCAVFAMVR